MRLKLWRQTPNSLFSEIANRLRKFVCILKFQIQYFSSAYDDRGRGFSNFFAGSRSGFQKGRADREPPSGEKSGRTNDTRPSQKVAVRAATVSLPRERTVRSGALPSKHHRRPQSWPSGLREPFDLVSWRPRLLGAFPVQQTR